MTASFDHIITTKPHDVRAVFISDLHLSHATDNLNQAFLYLLNDLIALPSLKHLYILGDWLDGWIGDDDLQNQFWLIPIINQLKILSKNTVVYIMSGNRDFMISQRLCNYFDGQYISSPFFIKQSNRIIRLEHGDKLCTDDKYYQYYRKIIQNPISKLTLNKLPLSFRQKLKAYIHRQATSQKNHKNQSITNTNAQAVQMACKNVHILIHGHTHRPFVHHLDSNKQCIVLGDWQYNNHWVNAKIAVWLDNAQYNTIELCQFKQIIR